MGVSDRGNQALAGFGFDKVNIYASKKELRIGTWMDDGCSSDYHGIKKFKGFGYYYTTSEWQKNKNYKKVPRLKEKKPLKSSPKDLEFLKSCC